MALRSGYYGIKKKILNKLLPDYTEPDVLTNKELTDALADTGWKDATVNTDTVASGNIKYRVKSGICYVIIDNIVMNAVGDNQTVATDLPLADGSIFSVDAIAGSGANAPIGNGFYILNNFQAIRGHIKSTNACYASFSYICKETTANRSLPEATREAAPEDVTPEEEPVVKKTTTRKKSTAAADTEKEGE